MFGEVNLRALAVSLLFGPSIAMGQCIAETEWFETLDGGCKDLATGLVWSPDLGISSTPLSNAQRWCDFELNESPYGLGYTDWRVPTLGEVQRALENGLYFHLMYFADGSLPEDHESEHYLLACETRVRGAEYQYEIRHADGDVQLTNSAGRILCVRGAPADPENDCPGKQRGGGVKGKNAMLMPRGATLATLLSPLFMVAVISLSRRKQP